MSGERLSLLAVVAAATLVAVVSARPYAGGWNDGSRLATVESLVDHRTWAIDGSIFVVVPEGRSPYPPWDPALGAGTRDKLRIDGHFYSDKPPVPALVMAGLYQVLRWTSGLEAAATPGTFCYAMTVGTVGLAYVISLVCLFLLGWRLGLPLGTRAALTASLGLATVAPVYARHVNGHLLLLGAVSVTLLQLVKLATAPRGVFRQGVGIGAVAGFGYTMDLGVGPVLLAATVGVVVTRAGARGLAGVLLGSLPWVALHHGLSFAIAGTLWPMNAVPEYLSWPGSPFEAGNMTGRWHHTPAHFVVYAAALLFGKRGFIGHDLPLFLLVARAPTLWRRRGSFSPEILFAAALSAGTWLIYAAGSSNYSGQCVSIRWFVPLLGPAYFLIAILLRDCRGRRSELVLLSAWGALLTALLWWEGPWARHLAPFYWPLQAAALASWAAWARYAAKTSETPPASTIDP